MSISNEIPERESDVRPIVWFDIDNTLYSTSAKISQAMGERIHAYFVGLGHSEEEASELHHRYYSQYGLALRGLVRHHEVDALDFDQKCDGSLPLEDMLTPDPKLRQLLQDIDRSKVRVWALTNAYKTHAYRVLRILGIEDQFEDVVFCDYSNPAFACKPEPEYFRNAMEQAKVTDSSQCYFIDDSKLNIEAALALGWGHCVHFCEQGMKAVEGGKVKEIGQEGSVANGAVVIARLEELRTVWPEIFKSS